MPCPHLLGSSAPFLDQRRPAAQVRRHPEVIVPVHSICSPLVIRALIMPPVISALLAYLMSRVRAHRSMQLEILAWRHQLAVSQHSVKRPSLRPSDRLLWVWRLLQDQKN